MTPKYHCIERAKRSHIQEPLLRFWMKQRDHRMASNGNKQEPTQPSHPVYTLSYCLTFMKQKSIIPKLPFNIMKEFILLIWIEVMKDGPTCKIIDNFDILRVIWEDENRENMMIGKWVINEKTFFRGFKCWSREMNNDDMFSRFLSSQFQGRMLVGAKSTLSTRALHLSCPTYAFGQSYQSAQ